MIIVFSLVSCNKNKQADIYPIVLNLYNIEKEDIKAYFINDTTDANDEILNADTYTYENIDVAHWFNINLKEKIVFNSINSASFIHNKSNFKESFDAVFRNMKVGFQKDIVEFIIYNQFSDSFDTLKAVGNINIITIEGTFIKTGTETGVEYQKLSIKEIKKSLQIDWNGDINDTIRYYHFKLEYN